ncbi:YgjP-like metallopeptidase domain-containing protein, partial [Paracoccus sp. (in: a-proteobacteria)]
VRRAVLTRMAWVRRQQARFLTQERQSKRLYRSGETHYVWGRPLRLEVVEWNRRKHKIAVLGNDRLSMNSPLNSSRDQRATWMAAWRRAELRMVSAPKVQKWSEILGVTPSKWGSCNAAKGIVWLNTELSAKPINATDYVILHELAHLISDRHDDQFVAVLNQHMP